MAKFIDSIGIVFDDEERKMFKQINTSTGKGKSLLPNMQKLIKNWCFKEKVHKIPVQHISDYPRGYQGEDCDCHLSPEDGCGCGQHKNYD